MRSKAEGHSEEAKKPVRMAARRGEEINAELSRKEIIDQNL